MENAVASMALLSVFATEAFAAEKFACAEYFQATPARQKKAEARVEGTLIFDANSKKVELLTTLRARLLAGRGQTGTNRITSCLPTTLAKPFVRNQNLGVANLNGRRRALALSKASVTKPLSAIRVYRRYWETRFDEKCRATRKTAPSYSPHVQYQFTSWIVGKP